MSTDKEKTVAKRRDNEGLGSSELWRQIVTAGSVAVFVGAYLAAAVG